MTTQETRHDWTLEEIRHLHDLPPTNLVHRAQSVHRTYQEPDAVQLCTLLSIKTGACSEDCSYCPQSGRYETSTKKEPLMEVHEVLKAAKRAKENGASRFCMGAAWRNAKQGKDFENVLSMIRGIRGLGMEACATLGMLDDKQTEQLADAGLTAYNHNLDTSREFYPSIITTRTYDERLETLDRVAKAGISTCCGGIIGMGESIEDRCKLLLTLSHFTPHPSSVPINALVPVEGTPLEKQEVVDPIELVRMCATARIVMPKSIVRLSAGREAMSKEAQLLCFLAGANSIFYGEKLLTTANPDANEDMALLELAGLKPLEPTEQHHHHAS
ncbi:MAG: biotin synthase BioB [Myxococcales bacterium]|nr:MAG: biotin synthase BioB [Myxococcales bacterium]